MDNQRKREGNTTAIAEIEGITRQRVNQIYKQYKDTGEIPKPKKGNQEKNYLKK